MILVRFALVGLIIYLIVRSFMRFSEREVPDSKKPGPEQGTRVSNKGISKKIGEYVDYEEVDKGVE